MVSQKLCNFALEIRNIITYEYEERSSTTDDAVAGRGLPREDP